jgi:pimeloyl-ACP methyl ester carboxylesterase
MLAAIDGTGPYFDSSYDAKMKNSFVRRIANQSQVPNTVYYRGPDTSGLSAPGKLIPPITIAFDVVRAVAAGDTKVFLVGYSRGGAMAINVAAILAGQNIEVEGLFLFDAVDRSLELAVSSIPRNVRHAYHATRMPSAGSRFIFGNCGTDGTAAGEFLMRRFLTTHAGMGGVPWGEDGVAGAIRREQNALHPCVPDKLTFLPGGRVVSPPLNGAPALALERQRAVATAHIVEDYAIGTTNLTVAQERDGMEQVRSWMWWNLWSRGVIA